MREESKNVAPTEWGKTPGAFSLFAFQLLSPVGARSWGEQPCTDVSRFFVVIPLRRNNTQQLIGNFRTMFLFRGIVAVLFGIIALVWPKLTLSALVLVFGVFAVISGITAVAAALRSTDVQGWGLLLFEVILRLPPGVTPLPCPAITPPPLLYPLAPWATITRLLDV